jgi:hypothetical protein
MEQKRFTVIVEQPKPSVNYAVLRPKRQLRAGDTVIFQDGDKQSSVVLNFASEPDTPGIMKQYQLIGWVTPVKIERVNEKAEWGPTNVKIVEVEN